ncbi:MAG: TIGR01777 family protein [Bacteroidia bacterium]|nr:TIGR01777 family protein [Bacteroidia bacterium]
MTKILITGGTGAVGVQLTKLLKEQGHEVFCLSRDPQKSAIPAYKWDIKKKMIDPACLSGIDAIVHLAGAPVAGQRWTKAYKKEIYVSRVLSTRLLFQLLETQPHHVKTFVAASAVGIYGNKVLQKATENYATANDFLARVCKRWEEESLTINRLNIRTVIIRTGIVLNADSGFVSAIAKVAKLFIGAPLANGKMLTPWIHKDDICGIYIKAITDLAMNGIYNGVAPDICTNKEITSYICDALHRPMWPVSVPAFMMKLIFGEMGMVILANQNISCKKITEAGYHFKYKHAKEAIDALLR